MDAREANYINTHYLIMEYDTTLKRPKYTKEFMDIDSPALWHQLPERNPESKSKYFQDDLPNRPNRHLINAGHDTIQKRSRCLWTRYQPSQDLSQI